MEFLKFVVLLYLLTMFQYFVQISDTSKFSPYISYREAMRYIVCSDPFPKPNSTCLLFIIICQGLAQLKDKLYLHVICVPDPLHVICVPDPLHVICVPDPLHVICVPDPLHVICVPDPLHVICVPDPLHVICVPDPLHVICVPDPLQTFST